MAFATMTDIITTGPLVSLGDNEPKHRATCLRVMSSGQIICNCDQGNSYNTVEAVGQKFGNTLALRADEDSLHKLRNPPHYLESLTDSRDATHGSLLARGELVQTLKDIMRSSDNWSKLSGGQKETLDMIQHKISRILQGDPNHLDHWDDLAGYPMQCVKEMRRRKSSSSGDLS